MRKAILLLFLGVLAVAPGWAQAGCPADIFDSSTSSYLWILESSEADQGQAEDQAKAIRLQVRFGAAYLDLLPKAHPDDPPKIDRNKGKAKALFAREGQISVEVKPIGGDLSPLRIVPGEDKVDITRTQVTVEVPVAELTKTASSISVVFPPGSLLCKDVPTSKEVLVALPKSQDGKSLTAFSQRSNDATRPWDWKFDLAPAPKDAKEKSGVTFDFDAEKVWGFNLKIDEEEKSWSSAVWRLQFDATGASNDIAFHDALKVDFSWAWNKSYLGSGLKGKPVTAFWMGAYVRPEATVDVDSLDYVYGARAEFLLNTEALFGLKVPGIRPYLAFGYEAVNPEKRKDGVVPDNYDRATGNFYWKAQAMKGVIFEASWEGRYIPDRADATRLGFTDRLQQRVDVTISLLIPGNEQFLPFLRYTEGETGPIFTKSEEVLLGFAWAHLFPGEQAP